MAAFDGLELELQSLVARVRHATVQIPDMRKGEKQDASERAKRDVREAEHILQQMEDRVREVPSSQRQSMTTQLRAFKDQVRSLTVGLRRAMVMTPDEASARRELFGDEESASAPLLSHLPPEERAAANTNRLKASNDRLATTRRLADETEQLGIGVMGSLGNQRSRLTGLRDELHATHVSLGQSNRVLRLMGRRALTNKVLMWVVVLAVVAMLAYIVYYKFLR